MVCEIAYELTFQENENKKNKQKQKQNKQKSIVSEKLTNPKLSPMYSLGKVRFFVGGGGGGAECWGILVFFPKKVLALPYVLIRSHNRGRRP